MYSTSKKMIVAGILTLSILGAGASSSLAEEEVPSADASVAFLSKYVWRGFELSDDSLVIQPSLTASYKGFSANLWGNLDTKYFQTEAHNWSETDWTLSYDGAYEKLGYGVGWIYYALEDVADKNIRTNDTQEFYGTVSYDVLLAPTFTFYYDISDFKGLWYANLGFSHTFMIAEKYGLDLGLAFGYLDDNADYSEFQDGLLSASMSFPIGEYIAITPEIYWSFALSSKSSDLIETGPSNKDNFVYGGVSASFSF
jgi:hypothetical protein